MSLKRFELSGHIVLQAEDFDEALIQLATHFVAISGGEPSRIPQEGSNAVVKELSPSGILLSSRRVT